MTERRIRLILLDFDGTLADTRRANTLAYVATLREAGYPLTEAEYEACYFGMRCDEFLRERGITDPKEREHLRLRKIALYPTFFDTVRLNEPLWNFCRQFQRQWRTGMDRLDGQSGQYRQCDAPSWHRRTGRRCPERPSRRHLSGADVVRSKPAPDCFLEAMRREGCTPSETLIFEDSDVGIEAARRSGAGYFRIGKEAFHP